jgi:putative acetyltransferase
MIPTWTYAKAKDAVAVPRLSESKAFEIEQRGYRRLSLETGSMPDFEPARRLYRKAGFEECSAFTGYKPDPNSVFFTMEL